MVQFQDERPREPSRPAAERLTVWAPEYVVLRASQDWIVSPETAAWVVRLLQRRWLRPKWIRFVDITGAAIRIELASIYWIKHSSPESRELWRRFKQERHAESIAEVPDYDIDF